MGWLWLTVGVVASTSVWVLLAYRLPREPSNPRVAVWRKLRRLGAVQMVDGLVALPADARTREQFDWLAEEIVEAGGDAWLWVGHPGSARQERTLASGMAAAVTEDYRAVFDEAVGAATFDAAARRRTLAKLRRELRRITARDFFPPAIRDQAQAAVEALGQVDADSEAAR